MSDRPRLDGAVPLDSGSSRDLALAALTRRVGELEHRLNVMKVIVGLVLAGKILMVVFFLYILFGSAFVVRSGGPIRQTLQLGEVIRPADSAQSLPPIPDRIWHRPIAA